MYYTTPQACSCPDHRFRGRERPCKHVKRLRAARRLIDNQREHNARTLQADRP